MTDSNAFILNENQTNLFKDKNIKIINDKIYYKNRLSANINATDIINVIKYKECYLVVTNINDVLGLTICDFENDKYIDVVSEYIDYLKPEYNIICVETEKYRNELTEITHFGQIISAKSNIDTKIIRIDTNLDIDHIFQGNTGDFTLSLLDISEYLQLYNVSVFDSLPIKTNSNTVNLFPKDSNSLKIGIVIMSSTYGVPTIQVERNINLNNNSVILKLADYIFVYNKTSNMCSIITIGTNGAHKNVILNNKRFEFNSNELNRLFNNVQSGIYIGSNDRTCITNNFNDIYFNPMKNVSEFYKKYIGVNSQGNVYDISAPINKYEIASLTIIPFTELANTPIRAEGNIMVNLSIIYKSNNKNIVAHIPIVTRLNTAKFVKDHDTSASLSTGEIYAFTQNTINGMLTQDDATFYSGENVVSIINDSVIKIKVDDKWYMFDKSDNTIPLSGKILPLVMTYGSRIGLNGLSEPKYYTFVDNAGNVSTFDKEQKMFIDISGNIDINIPFFSTQVMIYPSKVIKKNSQAVEVWAYSDENPYNTIEDKSVGFVTDFAKINNNLI